LKRFQNAANVIGGVHVGRAEARGHGIEARLFFPVKERHTLAV
jgi:hypothetical protein